MVDVEEVAAWFDHVQAATSETSRWVHEAEQPFGIEVVDHVFTYIPPVAELQRQRAECMGRLQEVAAVRPPRGFETVHEAYLEVLEQFAEIPGYKLVALTRLTEDEWRATKGDFDMRPVNAALGERLEALEDATSRLQPLIEAAFTLWKTDERNGSQVRAFAQPVRRSPPKHRAAIPDRVKMFVWQRDGGRCVRCASNERLEYDHIIPHSRGGSDTERNVQLLCEPCNRLKGSRLF